MRDRNASGFLLPISMHVPSRADDEVTTTAKTDMSWLHVRVPFRKAIAVATYAAVGSTLACVALFVVRGDLHVKKLRPPPSPVQVVAVDAPWTPLPLDAKPWTPAPYTPIRASAQ
jgi:hypothetical protein